MTVQLQYAHGDGYKISGSRSVGFDKSKKSDRQTNRYVGVNPVSEFALYPMFKRLRPPDYVWKIIEVLSLSYNYMMMSILIRQVPVRALG